MNVEIICPKGRGIGTQVFIDGKQVTGISHLKLEIPADGIAELTLTRILEIDRPTLADRPAPKETLRFTGAFYLTEAEVSQ